MNAEQSAVELFMTSIGQPVPYVRGCPSKKIARLRRKLIKEECVKELCKAIEREDLLGVADGIGDALYVILGTASAYGLNAADIFAEVHRSNMSKLKDGHRRSDGKWIKGPKYSPPNLKPLIK